MKTLNNDNKRNNKKEIPLVQIPYNVEEIKERLIKIQKKRRMVDWILRGVILFFAILACCQVIVCIERGNVAYFKIGKRISRNLLLFKANFYVGFSLLCNNIVNMVKTELIRNMQYNLSKTILISGRVFIESILINISACTSIKGMLNGNGGLEMSKGSLQQLAHVIKKNVSLLYINILALFNEVRCNSKIFFKGGGELLEYLKIKRGRFTK